MTVTRTRRLINPNRSARRKMSPAQIKHFGTKRQRAALKAARTRKRHATAVSRPVRRRASNPATLITLGALNPHKTKRRRTTMATTKRRRRTARAANSHPRRRRRVAVASNPRRRRRMNSRRRNSTKIYVMRKNRRRMNGRGRRNPEVFGLTGVNAGKAILSGLVGVYATKTITPMIASAVPTVGSSSVMGAVISAVVAWGGGMALSKWDKTAGAGFMFGGLMQAGSQLLNMFVSPNPLSLSGLGDFVPGGPVGLFPVTNPVRQAAMARALAAAAPAPAGSGNLSGMAAVAHFQ